MQLFYLFFSVYLWGIVLATRRPRTKKTTASAAVTAAVTGTNNVNDSMIGGTPTSLKNVPYQAAIVNSSICVGSGSIVGKKYILTSGFLIREYSDLYVRVGSENPNNGGQLIKVKKYKLHEDCDDIYGYDVVLLILSKQLRYSKIVKPIRMAMKKVQNGTSALLSGFSAARDNIINNIALKEGIKHILDKRSCKKFYEGVHDESNFCTVPSSVCACQNDFGAPLVQNKELIGYYIGGSLCCHDSNPQLFSDVSNIRKWVLKLMKKDGYDVKKDDRYYFGE